ncbi:unnamed protein product [Blumeria hordei]|uniref:Uncharacterized protein n=2 Tax=Blumeria hordei TaxID=2867405 RepID=A0A383UNS6_BLUHO|nr:hypothetical protein BGHDH14_bgh04686 [Blumeria hordei DH14]SZF01547.1 unnamed protein product [Blumeria hordei]
MAVTKKGLVGKNACKDICTTRSISAYAYVLFLNITISSLLYSFAKTTAPSLNVPFWKPLDSWVDISVLLCWKMTELGIGWFAGYDSYDMGALTLLSHSPPLYLLVTFYEMAPTVMASFLLIDIFVAYISFRFLRSISLAHTIDSHQNLSSITNSQIITSNVIQAYLVIYTASLYAVTIFTAYRTFLPFYLVTYFNNIPNITAAHSPFYITQFPATILLGLAVKCFVFTPALITPDQNQAVVHSKAAMVPKILDYCMCGFRPWTRVIITRTIILMFVTGTNTFVQTHFAVKGVEFTGALVYSALWTFASGTTGLALGLIAVA